MKVPTDLKYTESHEWTKVTDDGIIVGITEYAQSEMGDIVFADLPPVGAEYKKGESMAVIESVKAVSDIYAPVGGTVVEVNEALLDSPELINDDCYGEGWLVKLSPESEVELNALLSAEEYQELLEKEG
ncbi:MAG: glycine cleavage system protein GcvH [Firmicutes bacterium]|jgi:glycine cleavage system H protein|nr:glycine cleavage system protein GcvH [Bacillota bacterium]